MGGDEDRRGDEDEWVNPDEPSLPSTDDDEPDDVESSEFVFPNRSDGDFSFPGEPVETDTNDSSDDIFAPVVDPDTDSDSNTDSDPDTDSDTESTNDPPNPDSSADRGSNRLRPSNDSSSPTDDEPTWSTNEGSRTVEEEENDIEGSSAALPEVEQEMAETDDQLTDADDVEIPEPSESRSDGGTVTSGGSTVGSPFAHDGPEEDQEMPLADHIEEMVRRVLVVIVVMALVSAVVFPFADRFINIIWYSILGAANSGDVNPNVYQPLALVLARLKVSSLAGFVVALPVFVYETYLFMRPGLYPHERRYYIAAIPTSLVLSAVGVAFAFYIVLPLIFIYFLTYSESAVVIAFSLTDTFGLMLLLMGFFALIFQIPLFIMLAIMMGLTTRVWLVERRLYFWGAFFGVGFLINPDPTGMTPFIVAGSMVVLFEATLLLLKWTDRG